MRTVRRLYFYAISLVSFEVVLWGLISLLRTIFDIGRVVDIPAGRLAGSLALILVGLPVFLIHWGVVQRESLKNAEERAATVRSVFLYGILLGTLVPMVQNTLAFVHRLVMDITRLQGSSFIGSNQSYPDNLIAIAFNAGAAFYFFTVLKADWRANVEENPLPETRRLYRYLWVLYALGLSVYGVQQLLRYVLYLPTVRAGDVNFMLADGLALLLVGFPLWVYTWQIVQNAQAEPGESDSLLRLVVLYLLALIGVGAVLGAAILALTNTLKWMLGEPWTAVQYLDAIAAPLSVAIPFGGMWAYYGKRLRLDLAAIAEHPRQAGLRRLYTYILSAFGLISTVTGMQQILAYIIFTLVEQTVGSGLRQQLSLAISTLLVGTPLWWFNWRPNQSEAQQTDDEGDHARRSLVRKVYLYLALFAGVVGVMVTAGQLFFMLFNRLLGTDQPGFLQESLNWFQSLALFALWLSYHIRALRQDGRLAGQSLAARHARFPVLILDTPDGALGKEVTAALRQTAPGIPSIVHSPAQGDPGEQEMQTSAVILPSSLAVQPPPAFKAWLDAYPGKRLVVPITNDFWQWAAATPRTNHDVGKQVAQIIRQMAEGQPVRVSPPNTSWTIAGYVFGGLFVFQMLLMIISLLVSIVSR